MGESAALPDNGYPGEYLIELAAEYQSEHKLATPEDLTAHLARVAAGRVTEYLGRWAVDRLLSAPDEGRPGSGSTAIETVRLPVRLVIRGSTGPAPAA